MGSIANVVLRGRIFHFRRRVPDVLRPRLRLDELVRSLATANLRTAKLHACRLYLASESLFEALQASPMLTDDQLARLVQDFSDHACAQRSPRHDTVRVVDGARTDVRHRPDLRIEIEV